MGALGMARRVALVGCTGLLGDIIERTLAAEPDIEVVADLALPGPGPGTDVDADILVWNHADEERVTAWLGAVSGRHGPRVLAAFGDGKEASLWELVPHRTELGALSPATLVQVIKNEGRTT